MTTAPCPEIGPQLHVVGIGADGWAGLSPRLQNLISQAGVLIGGDRHLALIPVHHGQQRFPWPRPLRAGLRALIAGLPTGPVVVLASGDPLLSGIGSTLIQEFGAEYAAGQIEVHPSVSSVALARAGLGWSAESCAVISLVGRDPALILRELAPGHRLLLLSSDQDTPAQVATLLTEHGYADSTLHVLGNLGADDQVHLRGPAGDWQQASPRLNVIGVELVGPMVGGWLGGLSDETFENDGQLTRRDLRVSALARLAPQPGDHLWDVGAGAGSVAIEWMRAHPRCTATAIEANPERAERIARNARRLGVPNLDVHLGMAPEALTELPTPQAIFIGGGATTPGVVDTCLESLARGGRLVAHGVTLETEALLARLHTTHGGELTRIQVETAQPLGRFRGWRPARAVISWALVNPA